MKTEKTIKQLLQVLLDNQEYFRSGLCNWIHRLFDYNLLTHSESLILFEYINKNKPVFTWYMLFHYNSSYWWKRGKIKPRIKWINKQIVKELNS